jgi:hypothetical protein
LPLDFRTQRRRGGLWPVELRAIDPAELRQAAHAERYAVLG